MVDRAAGGMAERPQIKVQLLAVLRALKKQTPQFDKSRGLATLELDLLGPDIGAMSDELHIPDTAGLTLTSLPGDFPKVLSEAIRMLEAGELSSFVNRFFPPGEIARLKDADQRKALLQQLDETPEIRSAMLADFKRMQTLKPDLTADGKIAAFQFPAAEGQPARTVKLQKDVNNCWRLFDDAPRVAKELTRQAPLKPRGMVKAVQMERVGGNWRFIELPLLPMGPR